jgi:hypothetical protein
VVGGDTDQGEKNKEKIQYYLERLPDKYLDEIIEYLRFLEFKSEDNIADRSSMLLSGASLAKDWLAEEEDEPWKNL